MRLITAFLVTASCPPQFTYASVGTDLLHSTLRANESENTKEHTTPF